MTMTWPDVLRWLALVVGTLASFVGAVWTVRRLARPWVREVAREAADDVRADVKALAEKLATDDFPHMEAKLERRIAEVRDDLGGRIDRLGARLGQRIDRLGQRMDRFGQRMERSEARLLAAIRGRDAPAEPRATVRAPDVHREG